MRIILPKNSKIFLYSPKGKYFGFAYSTRECVFNKSEVNRLLHLYGAYNRNAKGMKWTLDRYKRERNQVYCVQYDFPVHYSGPVHTTNPPHELNEEIIKWVTFLQNEVDV